jgi:hypothetical protein
MLRHKRRPGDDRLQIVPRSKAAKAGHSSLRSEKTGANAIGALAVGAKAIGTLAIGALAIGALAIGAVAIGRLVVRRARIRRIEIDELVVRRLRITEELQGPDKPEIERARSRVFDIEAPGKN